VRRLPHDYGLKPRGRNPNGLLGFVYAGGCPETMARFIARQTRISHAAGTGGVSVAWAIDVRNHRIHTHDNPVSIFPPVIIAARTVYPGLEFLQSIVEKMPDQVTESLSASPPPARNAGGHGGEPDAYDLFIAYASEDAQVAREIMHELTARGLRVWLDRTALRIGDSLSQSIDRGLAGSRFGLVLLSRNFFQKPWTQRELGGMFARETTEGRTLVLPLWHEIDEREIARHSPILADKYALRTSDGISFIADTLMDMFDSRAAGDAPAPVVQPRNVRLGTDGKIHILFLAANSVNRALDLEWEIKRVEADLRAAKERDRLAFKLVSAATFDSMMQAMLDDSPTIVHFSGHGQTEGILLRNEAGQSQLVSGKALASLFKLFRETVNCVVLNACWSEPQARAIREHIPHVIGTRAEIADDNAVAFSTGFYKAIGAGRDVPFAYEMGLARVQAESDDAGELVTLL
ncbi:MAG TPA: TIR domain-containing protein, partial [Longimicrobium sp.]|nr:TIR domain-containing protein [Longimicrobium sp.]